MSKKQYDHQDDPDQPQQKQYVKRNKKKLQQLQHDFNVSKIEADLNQIRINHKEHQINIRHLQKDLEGRVTESQLSEVIALINGGVQTDPNIIKLLKTRQAPEQQQEHDKIRVNSLLFSKKLNQISQSLTVLMSHIRKLQAKITSVQSQLTTQFTQKHNSQQLQLEESRSEQIKQTMQLQQKMEMTSFELNDKMRQVDTKVNWRLNQFKQKIDQKISQEYVLTYLQQTKQQVDKSMKQHQLKSDINPLRIQAIEKDIEDNRMKSQNGITKCMFKLDGIRREIDEDLVKVVDFKEHKVKTQKRQEYFNTNFSQVYERVKHCQTMEIGMQKNIQILLKDSSYSLQQLSRINTVLINLKIGQDFQKMLQEMNPAKVLELQDRVDQVHDFQNNLFRQINFAKRQIDKINAKADIMGVMVPNKARQKLKKQEIQSALGQFLNDHQFSQKIANIDKQLNHYKLSVESVNLLTKQVARIQKQSDTHQLHDNIRSLQENFKKELLLVHNRLKEKTGRDSFIMERPFSRGNSSGSNGEVVPLGQASHRRSFSTKKINKITSFYNSNLQVVNASTNQLLERKALKN